MIFGNISSMRKLKIPDLYLAKKRSVVRRNGNLIMIDDERMQLKANEIPKLKMVRFRTLGCYPLTAAVESEADTIPKVVQETRDSYLSERNGRLIDKDEWSSMEIKKRGLFLMSEGLALEKDTDLLTFITCGSVDDGKSTLIGRLLHDTNLPMMNLKLLLLFPVSMAQLAKSNWTLQWLLMV